MPLFLKSINKAAFVIAPVFWQVVYMALTFCCRAVVFIVVTKIFENKIPPELKATVWGMMLAFLLMPLPLRMPTPFSLMDWAGDISTISYRGEYDKIEQEFFIAGQDVTYSPRQLDVLEQQTNIRFAKSLVFDVALPLIWAAGVGASLVIYAGGVISLKAKIRKQARPAPQFRPAFEKRKALLGSKSKAKVLTAPFVSSPSVFGILRPVILLPEYTDSLTESQQEYILIHETGHIRGGDLWVNTLMGLLGCVYWFIRPFFSLIRNDIEAANDSYVIRRLEKEDVPAYSKTLVAVLARSKDYNPSPAMISMTSEKTNMEKRLKLIKQWDFFNRHRTLFTIATALTAIILGMMFFTAGTGSSDDENTPVPGGAVVLQGSPSPTGRHRVRYNFGNEETEFSLKFSDMPENWQFGPLPQNFDLWAVEGESYNLPLSDFNITDIIYRAGNGNEKPVGYIGYNKFTPYAEEISREDYYQSVWPSLRLSSFFTWDPFTAVKSDENSRAGIVEIHYKDRKEIPNHPGAMRSVPTLESLGVITYNKELGLYVTLAFAPDTVTYQQAEIIAKSIELTEND